MRCRVDRQALVGGYRAEQPVRLTVDPVSKVKNIGAAVVAADPELDRPKAARGVAAGVDRDRSMQLSVARDEGVDLAMEKAEIADQHIVAEPAETGWCDGNPPRCSEAAARDQFLDEIAVFIEDRHSPRPQGRLSHVLKPGGRIGHVNVAANILGVKRD